MTNRNTAELSFIRRFFLNFNVVLPSLPVKPPSHQPSLNCLFLLAGLISIAISLHFIIAKLSIALLALFIFILKLAFLVRANKQKNSKISPPQIFTIFLTILAFGLVILIYGGWNGQRSGISFIVVLASLKFLESRVLRDYYIVCLVLLFLAATSFLFNSSIINIGFILAYTLAITAVMLKLSNPSPVPSRASISTSASIITKALPLALILFFFFPRIHGSFGFFPSQDNNQFDNELSNSLAAGDIASSAFNNELAFRAEFEGTIPSTNQLYWRSKVMPIEQNFAWEVRDPSLQTAINAKTKLEALEQQTNDASLTRYTILHERSTDLFIPYLDYAIEFSKGRFNDDHSVWHQPRAGSFSYTGASIVSSNMFETSQLNVEKLLETTSTSSARTQVLLSRWQQESSEPIVLAQQILNHFNNNEFYYSLYPPSLGDDPVDDFLFNTKTGYCEHYASLFTILMRWMGVPARVVVGYQGGHANQSGKFLEIRYSDAHAWSEILVDKTWVRVDPTGAVSPERIEFGMDAFMALWESDGINGLDGYSLSNYLNPTGMDRYYRMLRDNWNNIGYQWKKWVVDYDADTQRELLAKLGIKGNNNYGILVLIMFGSIGAILLFYFWRLLPTRIKRDEAQQVYLKFIKQFKRADITKDPADTPNEFAQKAIEKFPSQQQEISTLTNAYIQLRYGKNPFEIKKFKQLVKQFRLKT